MVSPGSITVHVTDAEGIAQITTQRDKFPKPVQFYAILNQFGDNVLTTEGAVWKAHRKATASSFNEKNAALVFREVIRQADGMINTWVDEQGNRSAPLTTVSSDIVRFAINIISYVGFGIRPMWPGQSVPPGTTANEAKYASLDAAPGYSLCFVDTLEYLMDRILALLLIPHWLLRSSPWERHRVAATAHKEYAQYLDEMMNEKIQEVKVSGSRASEGMDFMGELVRGTYGQDRDSSKAPALGRDDILGNAFIMFVAGYETSANAIIFTLINLATNPEAQRMIQSDIDKLVGDTDPSTWDYESLIRLMATSAIGACMNETLRLAPPVPAIPKMVLPDFDQSILLNGQERILPKGSLVMIHVLKAQEDPRSWPYQESKVTPGSDDLRDYKPDRWFEMVPGPRGEEKSRDDSRRATQLDSEQQGGYDSDDGCPDRETDPDARFFRPRRCAFMPFSHGARSCVGRRVAQVQIMTFLMILFQRYSLELATDKWISQEDIQGVDREAKAAVYRKAQAASRLAVSKAHAIITLGLHGRPVPLRLVKRGEEKFVNWMSDV